MQLDDWVLCRIYKKNSVSASVRPTHRDRDGATDDMLGSAPSVGHQTGMQPQRAPTNYNSLLEHDETFLEGLLANEVGLPTNSITHLAAAAARAKLNLSPVPPSTTGTFPTRHPLSSAYWTEPTDIAAPPAQRFHAGHGSSSNNAADKNNTSSCSNGSATNDDGGHTNQMLLNQIPYGTTYHDQMILGSLRDGGAIFQQPYQLPGVNWTS